MNYMKRVAQMWGVELGKEFRIVNDSYLYKLDDKGLYFLANDNKWKIDYLTLTRILNGKAMIMKSPILAEAEKEYLVNVIKPFREQVDDIRKLDNGTYEYIAISLRNIDGYTMIMYFPRFKTGTMYKGMEVGKAYSLNELGL